MLLLMLLLLMMLMMMVMMVMMVVVKWVRPSHWTHVAKWTPPLPRAHLTSPQK